MPHSWCRPASDRSQIRTPRKIETPVAVVVVALAVLIVVSFVHVASAASTPSTGPTALVGPTGPTGPSVEIVKPCTVAPAIYNRHVRKLNTLRGRHYGERHYRKRVNRRVDCDKYRTLKSYVKKARADCWRASKPTGASFYGYADSGGLTGACGHYLPNRSNDYSFAVLRSGNVTSDCGQVLWFTVGGEWYRGHQADTGDGGGSVGGYPRSLDFWNPPSGGGLAMEARALGLTTAGLAVVRYSRMNCGA